MLLRPCNLPSPNSRKKLTQARYGSEYRQTLANLDPTEATLLSNLASKGSSTFLTAYPADHHTTLANEDMRLILRLRLHLDVLQDGICKKCRAPADGKGRHVFACSGQQNVKHDSTQDVLMRDFKAYGLQAHARPTNHGFHHEPDLEVNSTLRPGRTFLEFYIPDPTAPSNIRTTTARRAGGTLGRLYRDKLRAQYGIDPSEEIPDNLLPMVWGIYGNPCQDTLKALRKLAERAPGTDSQSATVLASRWHTLAHFNILRQVSTMLKDAAGLAPTPPAPDWVEAPPPPAEMLAFPGPWGAEADNPDGDGGDP